MKMYNTLLLLAAVLLFSSCFGERRNSPGSSDMSAAFSAAGDGPNRFQISVTDTIVFIIQVHR